MNDGSEKVVRLGGWVGVGEEERQDFWIGWGENGVSHEGWW